jgi:hypothetical protein
MSSLKCCHKEFTGEGCPLLRDAPKECSFCDLHPIYISMGRYKLLVNIAKVAAQNSGTMQGLLSSLNEPTEDA